MEPGMTRAFVACLMALTFASSASAVGERVTVIFEFPAREPVRVDLSYEETVPLVGDKLNYKIDFWVRGALIKAQLASTEETREGQVTLTSIGGVANGPEGRWVYSVNGTRSPYHINTQLSSGARTIRFRYVKA
jgi:hypothetical protein